MQHISKTRKFSLRLQTGARTTVCGRASLVHKLFYVRFLALLSASKAHRRKLLGPKK